MCARVLVHAVAVMEPRGPRVCVCVLVHAMAVTEARGPRVEGPLYSTCMCDQTQVGKTLAVLH